MKKLISAAILIFVCFVLQSTVFRAISFGGIIPNLMVVLAASFGFMQGEFAGLLVGFFCGMFMDVFTGDVFGIYSLIYMYIGYINGKFSYIFYPEDIKLPIALIVGSDITYVLICYVFLFLLRGRFHFPFYFTHVIIPETVYTIIVTLFLYPLILWIYKRLLKAEKGSENSIV